MKSQLVSGTINVVYGRGIMSGEPRNKHRRASALCVDGQFDEGVYCLRE